MCKIEDIRNYINAHPITEDGKVGTMYVTAGIVTETLHVRVYSLPSLICKYMNKRLSDCTLEDCIAWYRSRFNVEDG